MKFNSYLLTIIVFLITCNLGFSQKAKHGSVTITTTNTKINEFTTLTSSVLPGATTINVSNAALNTNSRFTNTLQVGDLLMIMQMQGAIIKTFTTVLGQDSTYGSILNYNNAGNYQFVQVYAIPNSTTIVLDCPLQDTFLVSGRTQVIRVPRYNNLTINLGAVLTTDAWNGSIGGVLAAEVAGTTVVNGTITATGLGFRGGVAANDGTYGATRFVDVGAGATQGGEKGESIVGTLADYIALYSGGYGKGAPANGGGGGNAHNGGGGGGANAGSINSWCGYGMVLSTYSTAYNLEWPIAGRANVVSSGGGKGGYCFSSANLNPLTVAPGTGSWGGDTRKNQGGFGGRPLDYNSGRIYLGGGGGAGHVNNIGGGNVGGTGGNGGGLIFIQSYSNISGNGIVVSNGANGVTATGPNPGPFSSNVNGNDSGGGGGGGGTIMLATAGSVSGIAAQANGGAGGNQTIVKGGFAGSNSEAEGPGGGGGGGYIAYSTGTFPQSVLGATSGTTNSSAMTNFPPNGASNGADGLKDQNVKLYVLNTFDATVCVNSSANLSVTTNDPAQSFKWYNSEFGPTQIGTGSAFTTSVFTTPGTYTVWAANCPGTYREPAYITVVSNPTVVATSTTICGAQTVTLTASGATSYTWSTGSNSATTVVTPTATTIYTVTGTNGCTAQTTATVSFQALPNLTITPTATIICANQTLTLNTTGSTGTYSWNTGATSSVITVTTSGVYTATLTNACGSITRTINIQDGPAASVNLAASANTICSGNSVTLTATGTAPFTWNTSTVTTNSITVTNPGTFVVTVSNICGTAASSVIITSGPLPTITIVPASTLFCTGQTATLIASGASTYTWSDNSTLPTFTTNSAANFTVNGSNSCGNTRAIYTVTFQNSPDVSATANRSFLCPAETAVITATNFSGGGNFVWSSSANTTSIETVSAGGIYTVSYVNGCGVANVTVSVRQSSLVPDFNALPNSGYAPLAVTFTNTSINNIFNAWNFGNGQTASNVHGNSQEYTTPGIYTVNLVITNADGCTATISKTVEVIEKPLTLGVVPELVTPNNDGKNDVWEIKGIENFVNSEVEIFNRWGNLVYSATNYKNTFDGTPNAKSSGGKLPTGTYFFILKLNDQNSTIYKGYLQLAY